MLGSACRLAFHRPGGTCYVLQWHLSHATGLSCWLHIPAPRTAGAMATRQSAPSELQLREAGCSEQQPRTVFVCSQPAGRAPHRLPCVPTAPAPAHPCMAAARPPQLLAGRAVAPYGIMIGRSIAGPLQCTHTAPTLHPHCTPSHPAGACPTFSSRMASARPARRAAASAPTPRCAWSATTACLTRSRAWCWMLPPASVCPAPPRAAASAPPGPTPARAATPATPIPRTARRA